MPAPTANEIKTQLITLLSPIIGTALTKKVKLLDYLPLAYLVAEGEDPTVLRSPLDVMTNGNTRVNCLMITELSLAQAPPQRDATRGETQPRAANIVTRRFGLAYAYQFGTGSEATFSTNMELIRTTLNDAPKLGFAAVTAGVAGKGAFIRDHDGLQVPSMLPIPASGVLIHSGEGILTIRLYDPL